MPAVEVSYMYFESRISNNNRRAAKRHGVFTAHADLRDSNNGKEQIRCARLCPVHTCQHITVVQTYKTGSFLRSNSYLIFHSHRRTFLCGSLANCLMATKGNVDYYSPVSKILGISSKLHGINHIDLADKESFSTCGSSQLMKSTGHSHVHHTNLTEMSDTLTEDGIRKGRIFEPYRIFR